MHRIIVHITVVHITVIHITATHITVIHIIIHIELLRLNQPNKIMSSFSIFSGFLHTYIMTNVL